MKFRLHFIFPISVLLALTLLSTCKKDPCPEEGEPCPCVGDACIEEMKEWFYFEPGTYWIYQEGNSGDLDTVHVHTAWETDSFFRVETTSSILEEWIPGDWVKYDYRYTYDGSRSCLTRSNCTCHKLKRTKGRPLDFVGAATMSLYPFILNDFIYVSGGGGLQQRLLFMTLLK